MMVYKTTWPCTQAHSSVGTTPQLFENIDWSILCIIIIIIVEFFVPILCPKNDVMDNYFSYINILTTIMLWYTLLC